MIRLSVKYISALYFPLVLFFCVSFTNAENPAEVTVKKFCEFALVFIHLFITAVYFFELPRFLKVIAAGVTLHFIYLMFTSYWEYGTFFIYPHVFNKVLVPLGICCAFIIAHIKRSFNIETVIKWIYALLVLKVAVLFLTGSRDAFRWGSDFRIINSMEAGLLLIPFIHYMLLFVSGKEKSFVKILFPLAFIFIAQHRTVWIATSLALVIIMLKYPRVMGKFALASIVTAYLGLVFFQGFFSTQFLTEVSSQIDDIKNFNTQGTGSWRMEQNQFFLTRIYEKPVLGWGLQAFELGDVMEVEGWEEKGTHIHSAYIDHAYYFGLYGLVLLYLGFAVLLKKLFKTNDAGLVFCIFAACMFSFGTSYLIPSHAYFFCGWGLSYFYSLSPGTRVSPIKQLQHSLQKGEVISG
ncbi:MAG: O-antigen ligase family protein [Chitinophagaceae bacterium]|nr:O-antigen ligase family protein [Chitinophagaceae bacterium]